MRLPSSVFLEVSLFFQVQKTAGFLHLKKVITVLLLLHKGAIAQILPAPRRFLARCSLQTARSGRSFRRWVCPSSPGSGRFAIRRRRSTYRRRQTPAGVGVELGGHRQLVGRAIGDILGAGVKVSPAVIKISHYGMAGMVGRVKRASAARCTSR